MENDSSIGQPPSHPESGAPAFALSHAAGNLKLAYIFQPDPNPIRASPKQGNPSVCDLRVILSRRRMDTVAYLKRITIAIPIGEDSGPALSVERLPQPRLVTPGDWVVETSDDRTIVIRSSNPDADLSFSESSLVFVLPGIRINSEAGRVTLTLKEQDSEDEWSSGQAELEKLEAGFIVEHFYADQPVVNSRGTTVKLFWRCSDRGSQYSFGLQGNGWQPRDCANSGVCFTSAEGLAGIQTNGITETCTFRLNVYRAGAGGLQIEGYLDTTVQLSPVSIAPDHFARVSQSGRIVRLGWVAFNAVRCSVQVNGETYDDNAPTNTIVEDNHYFLFLTGQKGNGPRIQIVAHGEAGVRANLALEDLGALNDPAQVLGGNVGEYFSYSYIEPLSGGTSALVIGSESAPGGAAERIKVVNTVTKQTEGQTLLMDKLNIDPHYNVARSGNFVYFGDFQTLKEIDLSSRQVVRTVKMERMDSWERISAVTVIPNQRFAIVKFGKSIAVFDLNTLTELPGRIGFQGDDAEGPIAVTPDGKLALVMIDKNVRFIRVASGGGLVLEPGGVAADVYMSHCISISPDGKSALVVSPGIHIINLDNRQRVNLIDGSFWQAKYISNTWAFVGQRRGQFLALNLTTRRLSRTLSIDASNEITFFADPLAIANPFIVMTAGVVEHPKGGENSWWEPVAHIL